MRLRPAADGAVGATLSGLRVLTQLWALPGPVRRFYARALATAVRLRDGRALRLATPPRDLALLLRLIEGRRQVAEIGTGHGWTAVGLALADAARRVRTVDPVRRVTRGAYLSVAPADARRRVTFVDAPGEDDPGDVGALDAVYVDTNHHYGMVRGSFEAWQGCLRPGGLAIFHDVDHPAYPDVARALRDLGLEGERVGGFFVWEKPPA